MCYVCEIDSDTEYRDTIMTTQDVAFADQFKAEFRDLARSDFNDWLARHRILLQITPEQLAMYDEFFMLACRATLRLANHHELLLMLDERDAMRRGH